MRRPIMLSMLALGVVALALQTNNAASSSGKHRSVSKIVSPTGMTGKATYQRQKKQGKNYERFKVTVNNATPFQAYAVKANKKTYGVVVANAAGKGSFEMKTAKFIDDDDDNCQALPQCFPNCNGGEVVKVGSAAGIVYDCGENGAQHYKVQGCLEDDCDGASAEVKYSEKFKDEVLNRRATIKLEGVTPGESLDILVNGVFVTSVTAGDDDELTIHFKTGENVPGDGDCDGDDSNQKLPMPENFPSLINGDVVQIGLVSIVVGEGCEDDDSSDDSGDDDSSGDDDDVDEDGASDDDSH